MTEFDDSRWRERLRENRAEKDEFFADDPRSPLSASTEGFDGLDYFPPDPSYRVQATVTVHDEPEPTELTVANGPPERFLRAVTFGFELPADEGTTDASLAGYSREGGEGLLVPFRDKTTGQATYRGGRYMDLRPDGDLAGGDTVVVDFNLAYTPFCAFDDAFACPLPPEENWLSTTVPAGERDPPVDTESATDA
ncbi:MAG: protein of unknown function (DUF1684) [halophilic archaeon J07HB67]|nr:MAG: protein of unknown function (DUF1684) [halophilic archaeon J07HB67]